MADTIDTPTELIEQNHHNLMQIAAELGFEHKLDDDDPEKTSGFLDPRRKNDEPEDEVDENERLAWMFEQNAEAILLVAEEIGIAERKLEGEAVDLGKFLENTPYTLDPRKTGGD